MKQQPITQDSCQFCQPSTNISMETPIILKQLIEFLKEVSLTQDQLFSDSKNPYSFNELLRSVFDNRSHKFDSSFKCSHQILKKIFYDRLKISEDQLQKRSYKLNLKLAKRKYELDLICTMIKNIKETSYLLGKEKETKKSREQTRISLSEAPIQIERKNQKPNLQPNITSEIKTEKEQVDLVKISNLQSLQNQPNQRQKVPQVEIPYFYYPNSNPKYNIDPNYNINPYYNPYPYFYSPNQK